MNLLFLVILLVVVLSLLFLLNGYPSHPQLKYSFKGTCNDQATLDQIMSLN